MGTHQNGPSSVWSSLIPKSLKSFISSDPERYLGTATLQKFPDTTDVPFLFKILSVAKALPLQAHPDKDIAEKLHQKDRKQFVDSNHKPEIAVALQDGFRGFVGFKPVETIKISLEGIGELREAVGDDQAVKAFIQKPTNEGLKCLFKEMLTRDKFPCFPQGYCCIDAFSLKRCSCDGPVNGMVV